MNNTTIGGDNIIIVGAAKQSLSQPVSIKGSIMPVVSILVGIAAFNYAIKSNTLVVECLIS